MTGTDESRISVLLLVTLHRESLVASSAFMARLTPEGHIGPLLDADYDLVSQIVLPTHSLESIEHSLTPAHS